MKRYIAAVADHCCFLAAQNLYSISNFTLFKNKFFRIFTP